MLKNSPKFFQTKKNLKKENPESLGILYLLKCNSQNYYIIYSTDMCRSCQANLQLHIQATISFGSLFLPIWYPPTTGPESPDSWQPSALETFVFFNDVFFNASCGFLLRLRFVLFCGFLVSSSSPVSNFLHNRRTWARVTHVVADKHKREERIVLFCKTNDCRVC